MILWSCAFLIFCSRIPFLLAGYGNDPDAWQVVNVARRLATTGEYQASRLPGYPLPELLYAVVWQGGPVLVNGITALFSVAAFLFYVLILKRLNSANALWGGFALAFCPVIFVNSTNAMDYIWALALILASTYFVLRDQPYKGAFWLGLAIGTRITSGAMLLPLGLLLWSNTQQPKLQAILRFTLIACLVGALLFLPVFLRYEGNFLTFYDSYPPLLWIIYSASFVVWGAIGVFAIGVLLFYRLWQLRSWSNTAWQTKFIRDRWLIIPASTVIVLYTLAFLRLPHDGGYLVPIVPFVLLLLERLLTSGQFRLFCLALLLSALLITVKKTGVTALGPIFSDHSERVAKMTYLENYVNLSKQLEGNNVIIAGQWLPIMRSSDIIEQQKTVEYVHFLDQSATQGYRDRGISIYYLSGQRQMTQELYSYDLAQMGALPLNPHDDQNVKW